MDTGATATWSGDATGTYGSFAITAGGAWTYALDNADSDTNALAQATVVTDTFLATVTDDFGATATQTVTITITGTNDLATISGTAAGATTEDGTLTTGGTVTVADIDAGEAVFQEVTPANLGGTYGTFTFNASTGDWTYTLNNGSSIVQTLNGGLSVQDTLTVTSLDGTASQNIVVTITGTNDGASISGDAIGALAEDATSPNLTETGMLSVADVDQGQNVFNIGSVIDTTSGGALGDLSITAAGVWTYTVANADVQYLGAGDTRVETFTVASLDLTATETITITITGTNDAPVVAAVDVTGAVTEAVIQWAT